MDLPFTKPLWLKLMLLGSNLLSLELSNLAKNLPIILHKLIGLISENYWGEVTFGSITIQVWVKDLGNLAPQKNAFITLVISGPTIDQLAWKNFAEKPSGHGALFGSIEKTHFFNSSSEGITIKLLLSSLNIKGVILSNSEKLLYSGGWQKIL